jgi:hypothetical protein
VKSSKRRLLRAIGTDIQFWLPLGILIFGVLLLALIK